MRVFILGLGGHLSIYFLGGSILLAAIVLKLSFYGIMRLILPLLPKASLYLSCLSYRVGLGDIIVFIPIYIYIYIYIYIRYRQ